MAEILCVENSKYDNKIIGANFLFNFSRSIVNIVREAHFKKTNQKEVADIIYKKNIKDTKDGLK
tara:strand:+ start:400 stop:591 length:192 start_codon:yes stop_codon:yes gene_type:complete